MNYIAFNVAGQRGGSANFSAHSSQCSWGKRRRRSLTGHGINRARFCASLVVFLRRLLRRKRLSILVVLLLMFNPLIVCRHCGFERFFFCRRGDQWLSLIGIARGQLLATLGTEESEITNRCAT